MGKRTIEFGIVGVFLLYALSQMIGKVKGTPTPYYNYKPLEITHAGGVAVSEGPVITKEMEPVMIEAAEAGRGVYSGGINIPLENDWTTRLQDYSNSGGEMYVVVEGAYAYVHMAGTDYSDPEVLGGPYRTPRKIYIGSHGYQYSITSTYASVPIWSGTQYDSQTVPIGSKQNIEFLTRFATNP